MKRIDKILFQNLRFWNGITKVISNLRNDLETNLKRIETNTRRFIVRPIRFISTARLIWIIEIKIPTHPIKKMEKWLSTTTKCTTVGTCVTAVEKKFSLEVVSIYVFARWPSVCSVFNIILWSFKTVIITYSYFKSYDLHSCTNSRIVLLVLNSVIVFYVIVFYL